MGTELTRFSGSDAREDLFNQPRHRLAARLRVRRDVKDLGWAANGDRTVDRLFVGGFV